MNTGPSKIRDLLSALVQAGLFLLIVLAVIGSVVLGPLKSLAQSVWRRWPSADEIRTVFPQAVMFLVILIVIPSSLIAGAISAYGKAVLTILRRFEEVLAVVAYIAAFAMVFTEVVLREVFGSTLGGTQEAAILGAIIAGYAGFSLVTSFGAHLRANFLDGLVPEQDNTRFQRLSDLVSMLILISLAVVAATFVSGTYEYQDRVSMLLIPLWPFQLVMIYAFGASALKHLIYFVDPATRPTEPTEVERI